MLDEIGRIANGGEIIVGGDFNLTVSSSEETERPLSKKRLGHSNQIGRGVWSNQLLAIGESESAIAADTSMDQGSHHSLSLRWIVCSEVMARTACVLRRAIWR